VVWKPLTTFAGSQIGVCCVRTIVVWKLHEVEKFITLGSVLRENHSGMETTGYGRCI